MDWVTCPKCGFTQIASPKCLRCERLIGRQEEEGSRARIATPPTAVPVLPRRHPSPLVIGVAVSAALLAIILLWRARVAPRRGDVADAAPAASGIRPLDLSGRWQTHFSETLTGSPTRAAVKDVSIETDREGAIVAASVLLTDPGRGGAGAGYRLSADGRARLDDLVPRLTADPGGAALPLDFVRLAPWIPARDRLWRALEGQRRRREEVRYLLVESIEDDYLVQAGVNETGFLSYAFFSKEYASGRGLDALSRVIHPESGSSLRGFRNLVWDLSGAADFLKLEVTASISGPEGMPARVVLKRGT